MERLTNSNKNIYQECPKKFWYMIEQGYRPVKKAEALDFGHEFHRLLEGRFLLTKDLPKSEDARVQSLFDGYNNKWVSDFKKFEVLAVEKEFSLPLLNPATGAPSKTWELAGKIDAVLKDRETGDIAVMEHKTAKEDLSKPDSNYWLKLQIDPQISGYFVAAEKLGFNPTKIIYDVSSKPQIKFLLATPVEARQYTKAGKLYASQRDADETPEAFAERYRQEIESSPDRYFQRRDIPRLESDLAEYLADMWSVGKLIMESRNENYWPRRPSQCFNYGRCPYFDVCAKFASLEDASMFCKTDNPNPELGFDNEGVTNGF